MEEHLSGDKSPLIWFFIAQQHGDKWIASQNLISSVFVFLFFFCSTLFVPPSTIYEEMRPGIPGTVSSTGTFIPFFLLFGPSLVHFYFIFNLPHTHALPPLPKYCYWTTRILPSDLLTRYPLFMSIHPSIHPTIRLSIPSTVNSFIRSWLWLAAGRPVPGRTRRPTTQFSAHVTHTHALSV